MIAQFFRDPEILQTDIIAIQELWKNLYSDTIYYSVFGSYQLLYFTTSDIGDRKARVALYISRKINPKI